MVGTSKKSVSEMAKISTLLPTKTKQLGSRAQRVGVPQRCTWSCTRSEGQQRHNVRPPFDS